MITKANIDAAHARIKPYIIETPVMTSSAINEMAGCSIYFKCENFQRVGAFKMRGAMNAVLSIPDADRVRGVATHSSGNHGQAVARAAAAVGIPAHVVMPTSSARIKKAAVRGYGATLVDCEPTQAAREAGLAAVLKDTGAVAIHPYDDIQVITGQATAGCELMDVIKDLDAVFTPVGGGGLLSGTILAARYFSPATAVYAGEPEGANDMFKSWQAGKIEAIAQPSSIADGLLASKPGENTFAIIKDGVKGIFPVTEKEIINAMRLIWERMKLVIEPSSAVPVAALLKNKDQFVGQAVGIILTGGNVDLERMAGLLAEG